MPEEVFEEHYIQQVVPGFEESMSDEDEQGFYCSSNLEGGGNGN